tara:strand:+ start:625 stop:1113 length:489 start_codon:yes stop_codon:yes gene_type:complete
MNYLKISIGIFFALAASRFIPHPPNFTSLIALSFYVPALLGRRFIPSLIFSFLLTDLVIGFHNTLFFTWGSVLLIGIISNIFKKNLGLRLIGAIAGVLIFFIFSNFGVWCTGLYGYNFEGLIICYSLALPFLGNTFVSTIIFSALIEILLSIMKLMKIRIYN